MSDTIYSDWLASTITSDATGGRNVLPEWIRALKPDSKIITFTAKALLNTTIEVNYYRNGGILQFVFRHLMSL
jgi:aconitase A